MANWPGTVVQPQEAYGNRRILNQGPVVAPTQAQQAPQGSVAGEYPGEAVDGANVAGGNLAGDIGFYNQSAMDANSRPEQSDAYQQAMWAALQDGSVRNPEQANQLAARFGLHIPDQEALAKAFAPGATITGVNPAEFGTRPVSELRQNALLPEKLDAAARGGAAWVGLDDEIDALTTTALYGGKLRENLANSRAIRDYDEENNFWPRIGGEVVGSTLTGFGLPSRLREVGSVAARQVIRMGGTREAALTAARRAIAIRSAQEGAVMGGTSGFFEADGNLLDRTAGGFGGALAGGTAGAAFGGVGSRLAQRGMRRVEDAASPTEEFLNAAEAQGVDFLPADLPRAYGSQLATALTNSTLGAIPITEGAERAVSYLASARTNVASQMGRIADEVGAGQALQRGARAFIDDDSKVGELYDRIPIPPTRDAVLSNTRQALSEITSGLGSNEALSRIWTGHPRLRSTLEALTPDTSRFGGSKGQGQLSWQDLRRFRSIVGEIIGKPSLASEGSEDAAMRRLYGALSEDLRATAEAQSPQALRAFERANTYARARENRIERVITPLLGEKYQSSPEDAIRTLNSWSKAKGGDFAAVAQAFRSLPENEANTIRASTFEALGRAPKGRQDSSGNAFSPADFMTHWNDLSPRAKSVLFTPEHRKAVDQIVTLAEGMKASAKYANPSKTGIAVGGASSAGSLIANPILGSLYIASQFGAGKLLGSPRFARWMAGLGKKPNPSALRDHIRRLEPIARAEPAIAGDVLSLQRQLMDAFSGAPSKLAAEEDKQEPGGVVGQNNESAEQRRQPELTP